MLGELGEAVGASGASVGCGIVGTDTIGAVTGTDWDIDAAVGLAGFIGLSGLVGFVGFVIDFTHVFDVVCQTFDHTGLPYGSGQLLISCWMICPTYPA